MKNLLIVTTIFSFLIIVGCKSKTAILQEQTTVEREANKRGQGERNGQRQGPPSVDEVFKMDANNDGKLAKSEVKGPLERDFSKIDLDGDGFITKAEFAKAPKPNKGQGQKRGN